jgi:OmpA-OmpF porin, OOP family
MEDSSVGHTDTKRSFWHNQVHSERRDGVVKAEMMSLWLATAAIATAGKKFSDALIATGPGMRERQRRRADIEL